MRIKLILLILMFSRFIILSDFSDTLSIEQAKRVNKFLTSIRKKSTKSILLKKRIFTEQEINSYLNLIYIRRYTPEVKYLQLSFKRYNYVEGKARILLKGERYKNVPGFLKNIEVEFEGNLECNKYRMRFIYKKIRINGTDFSPEILDEGFSAAQGNRKIKKSIFDWFRLFPGIKSIKTEIHKVIIYY